ncbi:MAG: class I SAM-dependent methyltransferase [Rhodospirillaceae bacterium]
MRFLVLVFALSLASAAFAAETQSVKPGINDTYLNPSLDAAAQNKGFTSENRETFANRMEIAAAIGLKAGMSIADVGAGTGIYAPVFSKAVGPSGKVYAVDISRPLLAFIEKSMKEAGITNVTIVLGADKSIHLPPNSVDVVFTSDVYHHFEYPQAILADIRRALRHGGQFIVVDYDRIAGVTPPSRLEHVRTDKQTVIAEVTQAGFQPPEEVNISGLKESFFLRFRK